MCCVFTFNVVLMCSVLRLVSLEEEGGGALCRSEGKVEWSVCVLCLCLVFTFNVVLLCSVLRLA